MVPFDNETSSLLDNIQHDVHCFPDLAEGPFGSATEAAADLRRPQKIP